MADHNTQQERTQEPTQKRLQDAREKGQVPRSRELNTMLVTFTGACGLIFMSKSIASDLQEIFVQNFHLTIFEELWSIMTPRLNSPNLYLTIIFCPKISIWNWNYFVVF